MCTTFAKKHRAAGACHFMRADFVGNEPFGVMLGDVIMDSKTPALRQLMDAYEKRECKRHRCYVHGGKDISKYGIIQPGKGKGGLA